MAEVYSWHHACLALAAAFMFGRLRSLGAPDLSGSAAAPPRVVPQDLRAAATWGLLCGLCGTLHATAIFFIVPMTVALVAAQVRAQRWHWMLIPIALGASLIPLSSYAWIAWRAAHPAHFQWPVGAGWGPLWMHMRGEAYSYLLGRFSPSPAEWSLIRTGILPWILPGMALGCALALSTASRAFRWGLLALLGAAALQTAFIVSYGVSDPATYFLPPLMVALWPAAPGLTSFRRWSHALIGTALVIVTVLAAWSVPRALRERRALMRVDDEFRAAWLAIPFERGIVLWADDHYHRFVLLELLEGRKRGIYVDNPEMLVWPERRRAFRRRFGFDPLAGLVFRSAADLEQIPDNIKRRAVVPVLIVPEQSRR